VATTVTRSEFSAKRAQGFNRIPLARTVLADAETPLSAYAKLAQGPRSFLFESVEGGERWGRYSIIGLPAKTWLTVEGYRLSLFEAGECVESRDVTDPLQEIERYQQRFNSAPAPALPIFHGGLVGYLSWSGNMDTAIAIRTAVVKDGQVNLQAGAGVVADSVPTSEREETLSKVRAIMRAIAMCAGR